ncbi:FAD-dependent oxidoreductase [Moritella sp.]|uniref:FAD-dependent oxidoreductase n=1 Tax=Moritella sp. TaxID=78556 RepID=UPI001E083245|nr:FAD-dependent oxidoreductase [Moritella sp.]MCJ8350284.1 FAD-dependent oxidoreductase [Moritella sp.]NQZ40679.1 FAD-dependent oxidoreductase [Moritella sp.]
MTKQPEFQPFWFQQAMDLEEDYRNGVQPQALTADTVADVCIVGGGYTGLWTAIQLKQQQPTLDVMIIEKSLCGSGASGRNGGCMLTWSTKYLSMQRLYGEAQAVELVKASEQAVDEIAAFCLQYNIDAELRRDGTLFTATNTAQTGGLEATLAALDKHQLNSWQAWEAKKVQQHAGSELHQAGHFSPVAASVQPGKLVRGLKRVAEQLGVRIYENTPMLAINDNAVKPTNSNKDAQHKVVINTPQGTVYAAKVVMALNAWMLEQFPQFKNKIVVVSSDMAITKPIPEKLTKMGITDGKTVLDSRTFVHYYRTTPDGRLMLGKGGNHFSYGNAVRPLFDQPTRYGKLLRESFDKLFPTLVDEEFVVTWTGPSDRSATGLPFFGKIADTGNIYYGFGYSGSGVAQTWIGGKILASMLLGNNDKWSHNGLTTGPKGGFPPEPVRWLGTMMVRNAIRRKERCEDNDSTPFWFDKQLAKLANAAGKADK